MIEAATVVSLIPVALYQMDLLDALPYPPMTFFNSGRVTSSEAAHPFGVPDAILGIENFSATALLARSARDSSRAETLLAAKLAADAAFAAFNIGRQVIQFRKLCSWCTGAAVLALVAGAVGRETIAERFGALLKTGSHIFTTKLSGRTLE